MKKLMIVMAVLVVCGCETRSISNSGYQKPGRGRYHNPYRYSAPVQSNELDEMVVLSANADKEISEEDIASAASNAKKVALKKDDSVILIQSGAWFPDKGMIESLNDTFNIIPFNSKVERSMPRHDCKEINCHKDKKPDYNKTLRLAAARGGAKAIIVYWGVLESQERGLKSPMWVPIVRNVIPNQTQDMRISIKAAIIDVVSGNWVMLRPKDFTDKRLSAHINRARSDQGQVAILKNAAYKEFGNVVRKHFGI